MLFPFGPMVNAVVVIVGAFIGMRMGAMLPERVREIVFQGIGLSTLVIGMQMALATKEPLLLIFSLLLGGICGELLNIESRLMGLGDSIKAKIRVQNPRFTEGFVNASILFCIGAMAIIGSFDEGLRQDRTIVYTKSVMDGFTSIALASVYGFGVAFSSIMIFVYQGLLVVFSGFFQEIISDGLMQELTAVGGTMILGISLNLLNLTQIRLSNFLPAFIILCGLHPLRHFL